jgi:uncharacterized damage-inducible protein DinB
MMATHASTALGAGVSFDELLRHNEEEAARWRAFFEANPAALAVPLTGQLPDIRQMLRHIFAVELIYGENVVGRPRAKIVYEDFPYATLGDLFGMADRAKRHFEDAIRRNLDWNEMLQYGSKERNFWITATRRKMFLHAMFHSLRHWAQVATALRQAGFKQDWQHDFIFSKVME